MNRNERLYCAQHLAVGSGLRFHHNRGRLRTLRPAVSAPRGATPLHRRALLKRLMVDFISHMMPEHCGSAGPFQPA
jgi:hypothetical protein